MKKQLFIYESYMFCFSWAIIDKNNRNTYYPRFSFITKIGLAFPQTDDLFFDMLCFKVCIFFHLHVPLWLNLLEMKKTGD